MLLAVHHKRMVMFGKDFAFDDSSRVDVSLLDPFSMILSGTDDRPIDGRVAEQHSDLSRGRRGIRIQIAYHAVQLRYRPVFRADVLRLRRIVPDVVQFLVRDGFTADVTIHRRLKTHVAVLDDDVVDERAHSAVANNGEFKGLDFYVAVRVRERDDGMRLQCVDDERNGISRNRWPR